MTQILFNDGAAYERYMGVWSRLAGEAFRDWLAPAPGGRWLDVGCGNGAFTELIFERCAPISVKGIDPSEPQLSYARQRFASRPAEFVKADAMALPFKDHAFDAAAMPLVIFFVPEPAKGVAEMARVVAPGGIVAAYAWDMPGGGFPYAVVREELRDMGVKLATEPNPDASKSEVLRALWTGAGLEAVETREIAVRRAYADFDDYWTTVLGGPAFAPILKSMPPKDLEGLKARLRARVPAGADGRIVCAARANAVKGRNV
ncbi:MAG: class I SAM-dependent methyltransferase [Elusimicrobiota bacterium]